MLDRNRRAWHANVAMHYIKGPRVDFEKISDHSLGEPSENVQRRERYNACELAQKRGESSHNRITCNIDIRPAQIRQY